VGSKHTDAQPQILIDDHPLFRVTKQKYLGVIFNENFICPLMWLPLVRVWLLIYIKSATTPGHYMEISFDVFSKAVDGAPCFFSTYLCFTSVGASSSPRLTA